MVRLEKRKGGAYGRSPRPPTPFYSVVQKTHLVSSSYQTPVPSGILFSLAIKILVERLEGRRRCWGPLMPPTVLEGVYGCHHLFSTVPEPWSQLLLLQPHCAGLSRLLVRCLSFLLPTAPWLAEALPQSLVSKPPHGHALCLHSSS